MKVFISLSNLIMKSSLLLLQILFMAMASADLQNPDFELPPSNLPKESANTTFVSLNGNNTLPGWTFEGSVFYVTSGPTMSLPANGHAIQLGQDGKINQTVTADTDFMNYLLTFTMASGGQNCSSNANVNVSVADINIVFSLKPSYGNESWESYGLDLGSFGDDEPINLIFQSQNNDSHSNSSTCWPVIDALLLNKIGILLQSDGNILVNGGFETGPDFLPSSKEGILLNPQPSPVQSVLQQWSIIGTVKYIDSKHYYVPQGNAAIEIISGNSTGLQMSQTLITGHSYSLDFLLGDANDGCIGDFLVGAQVGSTVRNFTIQNSGTGSANRYNFSFTADSSLTVISFLSYTTSKTKDGVFCGPVVDDVVLRDQNLHEIGSYGVRLDLCMKFQAMRSALNSSKRNRNLTIIMSGSSMDITELRSSGMLSREELIHLFNRFSFLTSQPEVKQRIADAVKDNQEAVAITTAIQEEIFMEMGVDPRFGIGCLGKINMVYENDRDLMIRFYGFVAKEEMACDEAGFGPEEFAERMQIQQKLHEQQLEMLKHMRKFHLDDQSAILEKLRQQMENANFDSESSVLPVEQIQEIVRRRVTPIFRPR